MQLYCINDVNCGSSYNLFAVLHIPLFVCLFVIAAIRFVHCTLPQTLRVCSVQATTVAYRYSQPKQ